MRDNLPFKDYSIGTEDVRNFHFWKAVIGEGIATTFLLLSVLTGGTFAAGAGPAYGYALAFGFSVLTLVYAFNDISGGHVNNIISFALFLMGRISLIRCLCYTGAQIGGAILGALIAQAVVDNDAWGCGVVTPPDNVDTFWVILLEVIFTALLTLVALVANEAEKSRSERAIHIGLAVFLCHIIIMPFTGCAINPARATGPAIICGELGDIWIYWITGYAGSFLACIIYWFLSYWSR